MIIVIVIVYPTTWYQSDVNFLNGPFKIGKLFGSLASSTSMNIRITISPILINCDKNILVNVEVSFSVIKWFLSNFEIYEKNSSYRMLMTEIAPAIAYVEICSKM
jgi:hypothetical protein